MRREASAAKWKDQLPANLWLDLLAYVDRECAESYATGYLNHKRETEQRAVEFGARTEACTAAATGEPVSDFMLSFPEVRAVADLYDDVVRLKEHLGSAKRCDFPEHNRSNQ